MDGTVVCAKQSWGFIQCDDPTLSDIFYHRSTLLDNRKRLIEGERVSFEIGARNDKPIALQVRVIVPAPNLPKTAAILSSADIPEVKGVSADGL